MGSTVTCGTGGTCTFVIEPYRASADDYQAVAIIWGACFTAAATIWAVKRLIRLFNDRPEA